MLPPPEKKHRVSIKECEKPPLEVPISKKALCYSIVFVGVALSLKFGEVSCLVDAYDPYTRCNT